MEECIICFDEKDTFVFLPCAHKICAECKEHLEQKKCPICNNPFTNEPPIQNVQENQNIRIPSIVHQYTLESCSRGITFCLLSFSVFVVYQFFYRSDI